MTAPGRDFRSLRAWRGSQDQAFEELCYQLRDRTPDGAEVVKTGNPDAGLEWYVTLRNGVQWGWQAKFTFDVGTLLKLMERSLRTVVRQRPKCRRLTFCIPFDLPDAPEEGKRKSARQKFEDRKRSWRERIPHADRIRIQLWSAGDLLQRLVGHPSQRGIEWFFWDREVFSVDWCAERVATTVHAADKRYTPELHVDLPVAFALEGLARSDVYWKKYRTLRGAVIIAGSEIDVSHYTGIGVTTQVRSLVRCLTKWRQEVPSHVTHPARLDRGRLLAVTREVHDAARGAYPSDPPRRQRRSTKRQVRTQERRYALRHYLRTLNRTLAAFKTLLQSRASEAAERGALLLTGEAGQGKTHLFCDAAERAGPSARNRGSGRTPLGAQRMVRNCQPAWSRPSRFRSADRRHASRGAGLECTVPAADRRTERSGGTESMAGGATQSPLGDQSKSVDLARGFREVDVSVDRTPCRWRLRHRRNRTSRIRASRAGSDRAVLRCLRSRSAAGSVADAGVLESAVSEALLRRLEGLGPEHGTHR